MWWLGHYYFQHFLYYFHFCSSDSSFCSPQKLVEIADCAYLDFERSFLGVEDLTLECSYETKLAVVALNNHCTGSFDWEAEYFPRYSRC